MAETDIIQVESDKISRKAINLGTKKTYLQIERTIQFELVRNRGKFLVMVLTSLALFALQLVINLIMKNRGFSDLPENAVEYFQSYLGNITTVIMIIGVTFGGNLIAEDFENHTGNLLFPKISKGRLLIGRIIGRYILAAASMLIYYVPVAIATFIEWEEFPVEAFESMAWALYYLFMILSFVVFFSSFMKKSSMATVWSLLILLMGFQLVQLIITSTGVEMQPLWSLTYYGNIISASLTLTADTIRSGEQPMGMGPSGTGDGPTIFTWTTPSRGEAAIGMALYSLILLVFAYFFLQRRQNKE